MAAACGMLARMHGREQTGCMRCGGMHAWMQPPAAPFPSNRPGHPPPDWQPSRPVRNRAALPLGRGATGGGGEGARLGGGGKGDRRGGGGGGSRLAAGGGGERSPVGTGRGCCGGGAGLRHDTPAMQAGGTFAGGRGTNSVLLPRCCATRLAKVPLLMAAAPVVTSACAGTRPRTRTTCRMASNTVAAPCCRRRRPAAAGTCWQKDVTPAWLTPHTWAMDASSAVGCCRGQARCEAEIAAVERRSGAGQAG